MRFHSGQPADKFLVAGPTLIRARYAGVDELIRGLAAWRKTGARLWLPTFLALEAEGHFKAGRNQTALHSIEQALATSDETGERWAIAEILRVKANLLLT